MSAPDVAEIAAGLRPKQKAALLAFPADTPVGMADGSTHYSRAWRKAGEVGAAGSTMLSLQTFGGVDAKTMLPGPCLATPDWSREGCHWSLTDLGLAVRAHLLGYPQ